MTDLSLDGHLGARGVRPARPDDYGARQAARRREYRIYFALVLVLALPVELVAWPLRALRAGARPSQGPLRAAWGHAAHVTPIILSA